MRDKFSCLGTEGGGSRGVWGDIWVIYEHVQ